MPSLDIIAALGEIKSVSCEICCEMNTIETEEYASRLRQAHTVLEEELIDGKE